MDLSFGHDPPPGILATQLHSIASSNVQERARLQTALDANANNQQPLFQELEGHRFSQIRPLQEDVCRFPVMLVTLQGRIPANGQVAAVNMPAETFMFFEEQFEWNKKYLTYNLSKKEKQEGYQVPSMTHTYPVPQYYKGFPSAVIASRIYREDYLTRHQATNAALEEDMITENYYALMCN